MGLLLESGKPGSTELVKNPQNQLTKKHQDFPEATNEGKVALAGIEPTMAVHRPKVPHTGTRARTTIGRASFLRMLDRDTLVSLDMIILTVVFRMSRWRCLVCKYSGQLPECSEPQHRK